MLTVLVSISKEIVATEETNIIESQEKDLGMSSFIEEAEIYVNDDFRIDINEIFNSAIKGEVDNKNFAYKILNKILGETLNAIKTIGIVVVIIIISSILKNITDDLENKGIAQITHYVTYILIVTVIMKNFSDIINMCKDSISNLVDFSNSLIPLMISLMATTGNITTASALQPIILFMITFITNFIKGIIIPIVLITLAISIISNISDKVQIDKIAKFMNKTVIWGLGIILTIFVGVSSLESSITNGVDALTVKTTKSTVSNVIPIVGKILGDAVDTVMSCANILKNAVGVLGIIVIISICIVPIIKLASLMIVYYLGAALCQPIADEKIIKLMDSIGGTFKLLLAIMCSISAMLIIGLTLVIKISSVG